MNMTTTGVERRTVLKGAAWSVPVLAVAVAAPMSSASGVLSGVGNNLSQNCSNYSLQVWPEDDVFNRVPMTGATVTFTLSGDLTGLNGTFDGADITGDDHGSPRTVTMTATKDVIGFVGTQNPGGDFTASVQISFTSGPNAGKTVSANFSVGPGNVGGC